jgi:1-acyl-sn-glycerol-3-phosphate acyltransferase
MIKPNVSNEFDYSQLDYSGWNFAQRVFQRFVRFLMRLLTRTEVEGLENMPAQGGVILCQNHLHVLDVPLVFAFMQRRTVVFAADKWQKIPIGSAVLNLGNSIYVKRGAPDRRALSHALKVLQAGGILGLAPEGTRSQTGRLGKGHTGIAYLATRAPAPILPLAVYGQEKCWEHWRRLRRVPVQVRFGPLIELPPGKWRVDALEMQTQEIMLKLAALLPLEYRGVYADEVTNSDSQERL